MLGRACTVAVTAVAVVPHPPHMCSLHQRTLLLINRGMEAVDADKDAAVAGAPNNNISSELYTLVPRRWVACFLLHMPLPQEELAPCWGMPLRVECHDMPLRAAGNRKSNPHTPT